MKLNGNDLKPVVIRDLGTRTLMVPDEKGHLEQKECRILSFGLADGYARQLSLEEDRIAVECPTKPRTDCGMTIEFDTVELEQLFKKDEAFQTVCPGCRRPLGLIRGKDRTFFFGWLP